MPSRAWNTLTWDKRHAWEQEGDEWSRSWGGAEAQWRTTLLPRIGRFLPADRILEIATGHGRWTQFLLSECRNFIGVDIAPSCIEACQERFADQAHAEFVVTDGSSLQMVPDRSVDFAFSFDSLVHTDEGVIAGYLRELARVLAPDGVAVIHHSNLARYGCLEGVTKLWQASDPGVTPLAWRVWDHSRDWQMSAERFAELAYAAGVACPGQEIISWGTGRLIDCISIVTSQGSRYDRPTVRVTNPDFMAAARSSAAASKVFGYS